MLEVTARNFRCFRERQTARLAPLTLLVGDNGTGKTSFLALLRALWEMAFEEREPNFKTPPYDLGSFAEIAHSQGDRGAPASTFEAGFLHENTRSNKGPRRVRFTVYFEAYGAAPRPVRLRTETEEADDDPPARRVLPRCWAEFRIPELGPLSFTVGTPGGEWELRNRTPNRRTQTGMKPSRRPLSSARGVTNFPLSITTSATCGSFRRAAKRFPTRAARTSQHGRSGARSLPWHGWLGRSTALRSQVPRPGQNRGAPTIRLPSRVMRRAATSRRTSPTSRDETTRRGGRSDRDLRTSAGRRACSAKSESEPRTGGPFQIQVAKCGPDSVGEPYRNLMDAGYGVSQVLPVVTELLRQERSRMFLLQQPEAHLHPSAEAALGSLFGRVAAAGSQLVVETHSDHLIDRIRTDARDGATDLRPGDVSILYFERDERDVRIHSLGWDENGNLIWHRGGLPERYREFFRKETRRSLGL